MAVRYQKGVNPLSWPHRALLFGREALNLPESARSPSEFRWVIPSPHEEVDIAVVVTTCERPDDCLKLIEQLAASLEQESPDSFEVVVLEDTSEADYGRVRELAKQRLNGALSWACSQRRLGKRGYWQTYQAAFKALEHRNASAVFFVQDDIEWPASTVRQSLSLLEELKTSERQGVVLNLFATDEDEPNGRWVEFARRNHQRLPVRQTQWFDLNAYLFDREALETIKYRMIPVHHARWAKDGTLSSGVGRQLTRRLSRRAAIYQCYPPLAFHGECRSVMNPEARAQRDLDNRHLRA